MAKVDQIRSISKSKKLRILKLTEPDYDIRQWIISNDRLRFKACYGSIVEKDGSVCLPSNVAESLDVSPGDWVRFVKSKE